MKVYDEPPAEWAKEKETAKASEAEKKAPMTWGQRASKAGQIIGEEFVNASKHMADLPRRVVRLTAGLDRPQSMEDYQMLAMTTALPIAKAGSLAAKVGAPRLLGEMAGAGGLAGGQAMMRGEDPTFPALADAATTGVFGAAPKLLGHAVSRFAKPAVAREASEAARAATQVERGQIEGAGKMLDEAKQTVGRKIGEDIGWLLPELETFHANDLWGMTKEWGPAAIKQAFSPVIGQVEDKIARRIGSGLAHPKLTVPTLSDKPISVTGAIEGLINAGKEERGKIRNEVLASLRVLDPSGEAGNLLTQAMKLRAAGYTYVNTIKQGLDKSGQLDPEKLVTFINKNADKLRNYAGEYWPHLERILLGGKQAPVEVGRARLPAMPKLPGLAPEPSGLARAAQGVKRAGTGPASGILPETAAALPIGESGTTAGAAALASLPTRHILRHVPGGSLILGRGGAESEGE